jgi:hypothetical protein
MRTRISLVLFAALGLVAVAGCAQLKIVNVNAPAINCLFSTNCTVIVDDSTSPITFTNATGITGSGFLQSRTFQGLPGTPEAGLYAYVYRIALDDVHGNPSNNYISSLNLDFTSIVPFDYNGQYSNAVWVVTSGGLGVVGPSRAAATTTNITFSFNPPVAAGMSSYFFGVISPAPPTNSTAHLAGVQADAFAPQLNANIPARIPGN